MLHPSSRTRTAPSARAAAPRAGWLPVLAATLLTTAALTGLTPPARAQTIPVSTAAAVDTRTPDALIREVSHQALTTLRTNPVAKTGDLGAVNRLIDQLIAPWTDFTRTTSITVGRHWREATPQQRQELEREFRELLVMIYAGGLRNFGNQTLQFRPFRPDPDPNEALVRTYVVHRGEPVQVDYRLHKTPTGWKIYDVNVAGLWLTEAYRNQFKPVLDQGGVPALLKVLTEKTASAGVSANRK